VIPSALAYALSGIKTKPLKIAAVVATSNLEGSFSDSALVVVKIAEEDYLDVTRT
jgi:hypothetical protein